MRLSHKQTTTTPKPRNGNAANPVTPADDAFFLCWGSSVNVNEDLRRAIRTEVEDINASIEDLEVKLGGSQRVGTQLDRDLHHARSEMMALKQNMGDDLDVSKVNSSVRNRLGETLQKNLVAAVMSPEKVDDGNCKDGNGENGNEEPGGNAKPTGRPDLKSYLTTMLDERKELMRCMQEHSKHIEESKIAIEALQDDEANYTNRIESEDLESAVPSAAKVEETELKEKENEVQGLRSKKEALQYTRARSGEHAQKIADHAKTLKAKQMKHRDVEFELAKALEAKEREEQEMEESEVASELELVSGRLARLQQELELAASLREARSAKQLEHQNLVQDHEGCKNQDKEVEVKLATSKAKLENTTASLQSAKEQAARVEALKVTNNEWLATHQGPGEDEMARLLKEKENLAGDMNLLHQGTVEAADKNNHDITEQETVMTSVKGNLEKANIELQTATSQKNKVLNDIVEMDKDGNEEIQELGDLASNLELAISAEQVRKCELEQQKLNERQAQIDAIEDRNEKELCEMEVIHQVLLIAKELADSAVDTEAYLNDAPLEAEQ